jgi:sodium pump decarboxylase gamma subunit
MLSNILAIVQGSGDKAGNYYFDNFGEACIYALIGFLVVFVGIVIIIAIIWLIGLIMRKTDNLAFLTKKPKKKSKVVEKQEDTTVSAANDNDIPDEVKAAIVAAIMAYYEEQEEKCQFVVKRIKRI